MLPTYTSTIISPDINIALDLSYPNVLDSYGFHNEKHIATPPHEFHYLNLEVNRLYQNVPHSSLDNPSPLLTGSNKTDTINLATSFEDSGQFEALEHVRTNYIATSPNVKLYYPEPFIASASFMHNDLGFLHILQYQF